MIRLRWGLPLIEIVAPLPASIWAIALVLIVLYQGDKFNEKCIQVHERYHCKDQVKHLILPWFILRLISHLGGERGRRAFGEEGAYSAEEDCRKKELGIMD